MGGRPVARRWTAGVALGVLGLTLSTQPAIASIDREAAERKALAALGVRDDTRPVTVFAQPELVPAGTRITQAGPAATPVTIGAATRAGVTRIQAGRALRAEEPSFLFYADHGPSQAFEHPGRVALVGRESGRVRLSRTLRWVPLVGGRIPAFFRSASAYHDKRHRVFDRPYRERAQAARARARARAAAVSPEARAAQKRLADALAAERSCALRVSDTLGDFYDYARVDKTRASLGRLLRDLSALAPGFASRRYTPRGGQTPVRAAQALLDAGCRDLFLYVAGSGTRSGDAEIVTGIRPSGRAAVAWQTLTAEAIERLVQANRGVTFKLLFDAPYAGRVAQRLGDERNVSVLLTAGGPDEPSFAYVPQIVGAGGVVQNTANPFGLLEFTNGVIRGLERFVTSPAEIDHAIAEQAAGRTGSVMAWMLARSLNLGPSPLSASLLGTHPQRLPLTTPAAPAPPRPLAPPAPPRPNHAPVATTPSPFLTAEDTPRDLTLTATDADGDPLRFTVDAPPAHGTLTGAAPHLRYTPDADFNGADALTYTVADGRGGADTETLLIGVGAVGDVPLITGTPGAPSYREDAPPVLVDAGLELFDVDSDALTGATVEIAGGRLAGDALTFTAADGITGSFAGGTLTLTGTASLAAYRDALRSVRFATTHQDPGTTRTLRFRVSDGDQTGPAADRVLAVTAVNDLANPVLPGDQTMAEDGALPLDVGVADPDARDDDLDATVTVGDGTLTLATTTGLTSVTGDGTGEVRLRGSLTELDAALDGLTFRPVADASGTETLQVAVDDLGHNGSGSPTAVSDDLEITVEPRNDAPVNTVPTVQRLDEDQDHQMTGAFAVADVDAGGADVRVTLAVARGDVTVDTGADVTDNGTASVVLQGTIAEVNDALDSVVYEPGANFAGTDALRMTTSDLGSSPGPDAAQDEDTVTLRVRSLNDPPAVTVPGAQTTDEDTPLALDGIAVDDVDGSAVILDLVVTDGRLTASRTDARTEGNGTGALRFAGTPAQVTAGAESVTYTPAQDATGDDTLTVTADDGGNSGAVTPDGNSTTRSVTITRTAQNDAPVVDTTDGTTTFTEGAGPVLVDQELTVSDVEGDTISGATVTVLGAAGEDTLTCVQAYGITATYASGVLTLAGTATAAEYEAVLRTVLFANSSQNAASTTRTIRFNAHGTGPGTPTSAAADRDLTIVRTNDAPVHNVPGDQATDEDEPVTFDLGVYDADAGDADLQTTLTADHGELAFASTEGVEVDGTTLTGPQDAIGAALVDVTFTPDPDFAGEARVRIVTSDLGATGTPGPRTDDDTVLVTVAARNDAPRVAASDGHAAFAEAATAPVAVDPQLGLTDVDSDELAGATVTLSSGLRDGDVLAAGDLPAGVAATYANGTLTLSGDASVDQYRAALRAVTFHTPSLAPGARRTVTFEVTDDAGAKGDDARDVAIAETNTAPAVTTTDGATTFAEDGDPVPVDPLLDVLDPDSTTLVLATVRLAAGYREGEDTLAVTGATDLDSAFDPATGTLTLTGDGTLAEYRAALRAVSFDTSDQNPITDRTVEVRVDDGAAEHHRSEAATKTIDTVVVNDRPVVQPSGAAVSYREGEIPAQVDPLIDVTDVDSPTLRGATVTIADPVPGDSFVPSFDRDGFSATYTGGQLTITGEGTIAEYRKILRDVRFTTSSDTPGTARTLRVTADDGSALNGTSLVATRSIGVVPVNDAPTLAASAGDRFHIEDQAATVLASDITISDPDSTGLVGATVAITQNHAEGDELTAPAVSGLDSDFDEDTGVLTVIGTASRADYRTLLAGVRYRTTDDTPSTARRRIAFRVDDGAAENRFSNLVEKHVDVFAANDPPTPSDIAGVTDEDAAVDIDLTGTDPEGDGLVVQGFSGAAHGLVTSLGGTRVRYTPNTNVSGTDSFTYRLRDQHGAYDDSRVGTVSITVRPVDDAPTVSAPVSSSPYNENSGPAQVLSAATLGDVDDTHLDALTVRISENYVPGEDRLSIARVNGVDASWDQQTGTLTFTAPATIGDLEQALRFVLYENTSDNPSTATRTLLVTASDGERSGSGSRPLQINAVNDAPDAADIAASTDEETDVTVSLAGNDPEGDAFAFEDASDPAHGTVIPLTGSSVTYRPDLDFAGTDTFTYRLRDEHGAVSDSGTVTVTVNGSNDAPSIALNATTPLAYVEGDPATPIAPGLTLSDIDSPNLAVGQVRITSGLAAGEDVLEIPADKRPPGTSMEWYPNEGRYRLIGSATIAQWQTALRAATYRNTAETPSTTPREITFTVTDGDKASNSPVRTVTVTRFNAPPVARDDVLNGDDSALRNTVLSIDDASDGPEPVPNTARRVATFDLLANDDDPNGGTVTVVPDTVSTTLGGTVALTADGDATYTPPVGCSATEDTFTYTVTDNDSAEPKTDTAQATIALEGCAWYVRAGATGGDGTSARPFDNPTLAWGASAAGHSVFVHAGTYTGHRYPMDADERLIGAAAGFTWDPDGSGSRPAVTLWPAEPSGRPKITGQTTQHLVTLASRAEVAGLELDAQGPTGAVRANAVDSVTLRDLQIVDGDTAATATSVQFTNTTGTSRISDTRIESRGATGLSLLSAGTVDLQHVKVATSNGRGVEISSTNLATSVFDSIEVTGATSGALVLSSTTGSVQLGDGQGTDLALETISGTAAALSLSGAAGVVVDAAGTDTITAAGGPALAASAVAGATLEFDTLTSTSSTSNGIRIAGLGSGTFSSGGTITASRFAAIDLNGGDGSVTWSGAIQDGAGQSVNVRNRTGGTATFSGAITDGTDVGGGISATGNAGTVAFSGTQTLDTGNETAVVLSANSGTVAFTGGALNVTTSTGTALSADGGGLSVTGAGNVLNASAGPAVSLSSVAIGAPGATFRSITAGGGTSGITLGTTSGGPFAVTGSGTAGSGGTISGSTGDAISLADVEGGASFARMQVQNVQGDGIDARRVGNGVKVTGSTLTGNASAPGATRGLYLSNVTGDSDLDTTTVSGWRETGFVFESTAGSADLDVSGSAIRDSGTHGLLVDLLMGNPSQDVSVRGSSIERNGGTGVYARSGGSTGAQQTLLVHDTAISGGSASPLTERRQIRVQAGASTTTRATIDGNRIKSGRTHEIQFEKSDGATGALDVRVSNNQVGDVHPGSLDPGADSGVAVLSTNRGHGPMRVRVENNELLNWGTRALEMTNDVNGSAVDLIAIGNTFGSPDPGLEETAYVSAGDGNPASTAELCADFSANAFSATTFDDLAYDNVDGGRLHFAGLPSGGGDTAVQNWLQTRNSGSPTAVGYSGPASSGAPSSCDSPVGVPSP